MPLRMILRYLVNNEQLIQKLAESYPIRRAAQITSFMYHKGKIIGEETVEKLQESDAVNKMKNDMKQGGDKLQSFQRTFSSEVKEGFRNIQKEIEDKSKKKD